MIAEINEPGRIKKKENLLEREEIECLAAEMVGLRKKHNPHSYHGELREDARSQVWIDLVLWIMVASDFSMHHEEALRSIRTCEARGDRRRCNTVFGAYSLGEVNPPGEAE